MYHHENSNDWLIISKQGPFKEAISMPLQGWCRPGIRVEQIAAVVQCIGTRRMAESLNDRSRDFEAVPRSVSYCVRRMSWANRPFMDTGEFARDLLEQGTRGATRKPLRRGRRDGPSSAGRWPGQVKRLASVSITQECSASRPSAALSHRGFRRPKRGEEGGVCVIGSTVTTWLPSLSVTTRMIAQGRSFTPSSWPRSYSRPPQVRILNDQAGNRLREGHDQSVTS